MEQRLTQPVTEPARGLWRSVEPARADWPSQSWSRRCTRPACCRAGLALPPAPPSQPSRGRRSGPSPSEGWSSVAARVRGPSRSAGRTQAMGGGRAGGGRGSRGLRPRGRRVCVRAGLGGGGRCGPGGLGPSSERRGCRDGAVFSVVSGTRESKLLAHARLGLPPAHSPYNRAASARSSGSAHECSLYYLVYLLRPTTSSRWD